MLIFISLIILLVLGIPIGVSIGLSVIISMFAEGIPSTFLVQKLITSLDSFPLLAVPFFIIAGEIMQKGSMAERLLDFSRCLVGHIRGGLAQVSILTSLFFGALSGSAPATVAAVGGIMIPTMRKGGYDNAFSTAVNTSAGCLGVMIPPSIPLIIYGTTAGVSVGDLFIAGIIPGVIVGIALMVTAYIIARRRKYEAAAERASVTATLVALRRAGHALMVPVIVLGGIYGGIMTPTEAGASAVAYALLAETFFLKSMNLAKLWDALRSASMTTGTILFLVATATAFGQVLLYNNVPNTVMGLFANISDSKFLVLLVIVLILLVFGTFMDALANILIFTPLFLPIIKQVGVDPIHFGIVMIVSVAIGFLTPPVGVNLFVGCGISGISIQKLSYAVIPFLAAMLIALLMIMYIPFISLALI